MKKSVLLMSPVRPSVGGTGGVNNLFWLRDPTLGNPNIRWVNTRRSGIVLFWAIFLSGFFFGCNYQHSYQRSSLEVAVQNGFNLLRLENGMSKQEVLEIMGTKDIETFELGPSNPERVRLRDQFNYQPGMVIKNPFRVERVPSSEGDLEVYFYYTNSQDPTPQIISPHELTPVFFKNDRFLGMGDEFLGD